MSGAAEEQGRLTLRGVEVFIAVVEEGSLAGGAKRLGASPSSVSQQIANLEAALGAQLIERTGRPMNLTPAGYLFQRRALAILNEAARARSELAELELSALPRLRLAVIDDFDSDTTPELVARIADQMPRSSIAVQSGASHENLAALEARSVDIVVAADEFDAPDWIERHPVLRDPYVLFTAPGLLNAAENPVERLATAPMVRHAATHLIGRQVERQLSRLRLSPAHKFEFDAVHALFAATAQQGGWTLATPLCWLRAWRFREAVDIHELPFPIFARTVSLFARRNALGALPAQVAAMLREILSRNAIVPGIERMPWLEGEFRLLEPAPPMSEVADPRPETHAPEAQESTGV